jgi:Raf kinase inhibitor-like YbhB/YbcL family protein
MSRMRYLFPACVTLLLLCLASVATATTATASASSSGFTLSSPDPQLSRHLPEIYAANAFGCTGGNTSPPLLWRNAPAGTKSFVVTLFHRDERSTPSGWWHWALYDLPPGTDHLPANAGAEKNAELPVGTREGRTDLGNLANHGPCPAKGDPPHRYVFTIYALSVATLPVDAGASLR